MISAEEEISVFKGSFGVHHGISTFVLRSQNFRKILIFWNMASRDEDNSFGAGKKFKISVRDVLYMRVMVWSLGKKNFFTPMREIFMTFLQFNPVLLKWKLLTPFISKNWKYFLSQISNRPTDVSANGNCSGLCSYFPLILRNFVQLNWVDDHVLSYHGKSQNR